MLRADRLKQASSAIFNQVAAKKRELVAAGVETIDLSIGSPDLPPSPQVREVLCREAAKPENYGYTLQAGADFRRSVAYWYGQRFGVRLNPDNEVIGLLGSQEGLANICLALLNPGDLVLVTDPAYPIYHSGPILAGARLYPIPLTSENNFMPQLDKIPAEVAQEAKMIILNFPANPVASTVPLEFFEELVDFARKNQIMVLHDAAYCELCFDGYRPPSFMQVKGAKEVGVEFNSLSKTFGMAGCRIAYAVGNPAILEALAEMKGHADYGPFYPVQKAAEVALTGPQDWVRAAAATYQRRRDLLVDGLASIGWPVAKPKATMFLWARVPGNLNDRDFAFELMEETGVIVVPGSGFGRFGQGYVRIALVQPEELLEEAVERIGASKLIRLVG